MAKPEELRRTPIASAVPESVKQLVLSDLIPGAGLDQGHQPQVRERGGGLPT